VAAYRVQQWILDPAEYVVPTIAVRCLPATTRVPADPASETATFPGTTCVLGTLALWLRHVHVADPPYDPARFVRDARYAHHLANFNLVTYLIDHQDAKAGNLLAADDEANPRLFSVDNGITFGTLRHNYAVINWNRMHVPALTRRAVERLRAVGPADLASLATVVSAGETGCCSSASRRTRSPGSPSGCAPSSTAWIARSWPSSTEPRGRPDGD
jgi:hypothetical protein